LITLLLLVDILFVPEILAVKLKSCRKSHRLLNVFLPSQILRGLCLQSCTRVITSIWQHVTW